MAGLQLFSVRCHGATPTWIFREPAAELVQEVADRQNAPRLEVVC
jgi:hypothetical protein